MSANQGLMSASNHRSQAQLGGVGGTKNPAAVDGAALALSQSFDSSGFAQGALGNNMSVQQQDPFMHWQASDWLDLDASVSVTREEMLHLS